MLNKKLVPHSSGNKRAFADAVRVAPDGDFVWLRVDRAGRSPLGYRVRRDSLAAFAMIVESATWAATRVEVGGLLLDAVAPRRLTDMELEAAWALVLPVSNAAFAVASGDWPAAGFTMGADGRRFAGHSYGLGAAHRWNPNAGRQARRP